MHTSFSFDPLQSQVEVALWLQRIPACQRNPHTDDTLCIDFGFLLHQLPFPSQQEMLQRYCYRLPLPFPAYNTCSVVRVL